MSRLEDIAEYYNTTQNHYVRWWNLNETLSLHYGIWDERTKNFTQSLQNTNQYLLDLATIHRGHIVLDAGCGVGGAAFFINQKTEAKVHGISLSEKQIQFATQHTKASKKEKVLQFSIMDYCNTSFEEGFFDRVWACESMSSALNKHEFTQEMGRIIKKGGRMVLSDFFISSEMHDGKKHPLIQKWDRLWAMNLCTIEHFNGCLQRSGFKIIKIQDYTDKITKSARRMYYASLAGAIPSEMYNLFHPNVTEYARHHYKSGIVQFRALQKKLWKYQMILVEKL